MEVNSVELSLEASSNVDEIKVFFHSNESPMRHFNALCGLWKNQLWLSKLEKYLHQIEGKWIDPLVRSISDTLLNLFGSVKLGEFYKVLRWEFVHSVLSRDGVRSQHEARVCKTRCLFFAQTELLREGLPSFFVVL